MRVLITQCISGSIDGIQLDRFQPGFVYDVGTTIGNYLLAMKVAQPVPDESPAFVLPVDHRFFGETVRRASVKGPLAKAADRARRKRR